MNDASALRSGKGHRDENFPVASWLIARRHRGPILAFYNFVRTADDIADHATLAAAEKLALLDRLDAGLPGKDDSDAVAVRLRAELARAQPVAEACAGPACGVPDRCDKAALPRLGRSDELLQLLGHAGRAFRVRRAWREPLGWPANDALCAALQIINHLQDCQEDYRNLDRVYIPQDALAACGTTVEALNAPQASPALLQCLHGLAERTGAIAVRQRRLSGR